MDRQRIYLVNINIFIVIYKMRDFSTLWKVIGFVHTCLLPEKMDHDLEDEGSFNIVESDRVCTYRLATRENGS